MSFDDDMANLLFDVIPLDHGGLIIGPTRALSLVKQEVGNHGSEPVYVCAKGAQSAWVPPVRRDP